MGLLNSVVMIVFKIIGDHVMIFAHTRDQKRLTLRDVLHVLLFSLHLEHSVSRSCARAYTWVRI